MSFLTKRPNKIWYIVESVSPGKRIFRSTKTKSKSEANLILANYLKNNKPDLNRKYFLRDLEISVLNDAKAKCYKPNTITIYNSVFKHLNKLFKDKELNSFKTDDFNEYKILRKKSISSISCNIELRTMKKFFKYAHKNDMTLRDISFKIELYKIKDDRRQHFTEEELKNVFESIEDKTFKDICSIAYLTGSRRGEVLNIKYQDINFENGLINIYQKKPIKEHSLKSLHITVELKEILKTYFCNEDNTFKYFTPEQKLFNLSGSYISHKFKKILRQNKIDENLRFHSLRHTAATDLLKRGSAISNIQFILGHSSVKVTESYTHLIPEDTRNDLSKLSITSRAT